MDGSKLENALSSASILKYKISRKFPSWSRSFDCQSWSFDCRSRRRNDGVCTALNFTMTIELGPFAGLDQTIMNQMGN